MGQILDSLVPKKTALDSLVPKKKGVIEKALSILLSPTETGTKIGRRAANIIEGVDRPVDAPIDRFELPESAPDRLKAGGKLLLGLTGVPSIVEAIKAAAALREVEPPSYNPRRQSGPDASEVVAAGQRGALAGIAEGVGQLSPLESIMLAVGGSRTGKRATAQPVTITRTTGAASVEPKGSVLPPRPVTKREIRAQDEIDARVSRPPIKTEELHQIANDLARKMDVVFEASKMEPVQTTPRIVRQSTGTSGRPMPPTGPTGRVGEPQLDLRTVLLEALEEVRRTPTQKAEAVSLPSEISAPKPVTGSRYDPLQREGVAGTEAAARGPYIPDPGGNIMAAEESGKSAITALRRQRQRAIEEETYKALRGVGANDKVARERAKTVVARSEEVAKKVELPKAAPAPVPPEAAQSALQSVVEVSSGGERPGWAGHLDEAADARLRAKEKEINDRAVKQAEEAIASGKTIPVRPGEDYAHASAVEAIIARSRAQRGEVVDPAKQAEIERQARILREASTEKPPVLTASTGPISKKYTTDVVPGTGFKPVGDIGKMVREQQDYTLRQATSSPKIHLDDRVNLSMGKAQALRRLDRQLQDNLKSPPPPGVNPELHKTMAAVEHQANVLLMRYGVKDARLVQQMREYWGAEEAARRLGLSVEETVNLTPGHTPRKRPVKVVLDEMDARLKFLMDDPHGFARTEALVAAAGGIAGGLVGATIGGENIEDVAAYAIAGALVGGAAGFGGTRAVNRLLKGGKKSAYDRVTNQIEALDTANLLAGPAAVKASLGSMGGVAAGAYQRLREGRIREFKNIIRAATVESPRLYAKTLFGPSSKLTRRGIFTQYVHTNLQGQVQHGTNALTTFVLRPFIAADTAAMHALKRGGFSEAEAGRLLLTGEPTHWFSQAILRGINGSFLLRMLMKFPRVRLGALERGAEFTPGLHRAFNMRSTGSPLGRLDVQEGLTSRARRARAEFGGIALGVGTAYGYIADPSLSSSAIAAAAAGPAYAPFAGGTQFGKALRKKEAGEAVLRALEFIAGQTPQIGEAAFRTLPQRFSPLRPFRRMLSDEE